MQPVPRARSSMASATNVCADECVKGHGSRDSHLATSQSLYIAYTACMSLDATGRSTSRRDLSGNASEVSRSPSTVEQVQPGIRGQDVPEHIAPRPLGTAG